jgi:hypothetical protein
LVDIKYSGFHSFSNPIFSSSGGFFEMGYLLLTFHVTITFVFNPTALQELLFHSGLHLIKDARRVVFDSLNYILWILHVPFHAGLEFTARSLMFAIICTSICKQ